jgi:serine/threonine-protein kinase
MQALIDSMLGREDEAIATGERAVQLLPISADALDGPLLATNLAAIYAQLGRNDQALDLLAKLVRQIGGPTPGTLRVEPQWDPLRDDPRFHDLSLGEFGTESK